MSLPESRLPDLLNDLAVLIRKGYHRTAYGSDASVRGPEKYEALLG